MTDPSPLIEENRRLIAEAKSGNIAAKLDRAFCVAQRDAWLEGYRAGWRDGSLWGWIFLFTTLASIGSLAWVVLR